MRTDIRCVHIQKITNVGRHLRSEIALFIGPHTCILLVFDKSLVPLSEHSTHKSSELKNWWHHELRHKLCEYWKKSIFHFPAFFIICIKHTYRGCVFDEQNRDEWYVQKAAPAQHSFQLKIEIYTLVRTHIHTSKHLRWWGKNNTNTIFESVLMGPYSSVMLIRVLFGGWNRWMERSSSYKYNNIVITTTTIIIQPFEMCVRFHFSVDVIFS